MCKKRIRIAAFTACLLLQVSNNIVGLLREIKDTITETLTPAVGTANQPLINAPKPPQTAEDRGLAGSCNGVGRQRGACE